MTEIKTVVERVTERFDAKVNNALAKGFQLIDIGPRQTGPDAWSLFALLEKRTELMNEDAGK